MSKRGVVWVAYGDKAQAVQRVSAECWQRQHPDIPSTVHDALHGGSPVYDSRHAKTTMLDWSPYEQTLYLDADTRILAPVSVGFELLDDGFDLVIVPSGNQDADLLWHVSDAERQETLETLGYPPLQLQAGVMFVTRNERTTKLFEAWHAEWRRYGGQDQAALLRALHEHPVKVWILSGTFNGGAVIAHDFGRARQ